MCPAASGRPFPPAYPSADRANWDHGTRAPSRPEQPDRRAGPHRVPRSLRAARGPARRARRATREPQHERAAPGPGSGGRALERAGARQARRLGEVAQRPVWDLADPAKVELAKAQDRWDGLGTPLTRDEARPSTRVATRTSREVQRRRSKLQVMLAPPPDGDRAHEHGLLVR